MKDNNVMENSKIEKIKSLNLTEGELITLEKTEDRKELEAIMSIMSDSYKQCYANAGDNGCVLKVCVPDFCSCNGAKCTDCYDCGIGDFVCDCKGPVGYFHCSPYKG